MATIPKHPIPPAAESLEDLFRRLAATWEEAVAHHSSSSVRYGHPAYQEIISLGPAVVPLLFRDLQRNPRRWFAALRAITGANPVPPEHAGKLDKQIEAWLHWGKENGFKW